MDLTEADWKAVQPYTPFQIAIAFAVLHHLPGDALRRQSLRNLHSCLPTGALFFHSEWQFLNSDRLSRRIQPWDRAGLHAGQVETGDYLLDWRQGGEGLRYVHHFSESELFGLASDTGFRVLESFLSDGKGGRLGLYQVWETTEFAPACSSEASRG